MRAAVWAALLLAAFAGCILLMDPNVCEADDQCPAGQLCISGDCQAGQAAPDAGAAKGADGGPL